MNNAGVAAQLLAMHAAGATGGGLTAALAGGGVEAGILGVSAVTLGWLAVGVLAGIAIAIVIIALAQHFCMNEADGGGAEGFDTPKYENPGTHDPNGGPNPYDPNKSVLPDDAEAQFNNSVADGPDARWTKIGAGKKAVYYRYCRSVSNLFHWCGSTNGKTLSGRDYPIRLQDVPIGVRRG